MRWISPPLEPEGVTYAMTVLWNQAEGAPMKTKISMLAIDLAKGSFQVCAVGQDGAVLSNRALSRTRLAALLAEQPTCVVAMEACATSHHWGRLAQAYGHEVRLVPAAYVKPFVKRQKNDRADAEAIAEAALRPTMRFVAVKSAETQGPRGRVPNPPVPRPAAHAAHQRAAGPPRGVRPRCAEGAGQPEAAGERARRRDRRPARSGPRDGRDLPRADREPHRGDREARGGTGGGDKDR